MDKFEFKKYLYYGIIGVISFLVLVFLPMIGSEANIGFNLPNTTAGWTIYIVIKLLVAVLNMLIFHCFMQQAKLNVRDNENFKKANDILNRVKNHEITPMSPNKWTAKQYSTKGVTLVISTITGTFALTNALLTYDYMALLAYSLIIIMGIVFGIIQMKTAEAYWTNEYYQYALMREEEEKIKEDEEDHKFDKLFELTNKDEIKVTRKEINKCLQLMIENTETLKNK